MKMHALGTRYSELKNLTTGKNTSVRQLFGKYSLSFNELCEEIIRRGFFNICFCIFCKTNCMITQIRTYLFIYMHHDHNKTNQVKMLCDFQTVSKLCTCLQDGKHRNITD